MFDDPAQRRPYSVLRRSLPSAGSTMKRSSTIRVTLLASVAAACGCTDTSAHCVDSSNRVVADSLCASAARTDSAARAPGHVGTAIIMSPYRYYYGGSFGGMGSVISGGSYSAPEASVSHGGFGGEGEAHGGGGGE